MLLRRHVLTLSVVILINISHLHKKNVDNYKIMRFI